MNEYANTNPLTPTSLNSDIKLKVFPGVTEKLNQIFKCIAEGDPDEVSQILKDGSSLTRGSLNIALEKAFQAYKQDNENSKQIIALLLNSKADVNYNLPNMGKEKKTSIYTGLMHACFENYFPLTAFLINYGAKINIKDSCNRNCLFYALNSPHLKEENSSLIDIVQLLINNKININEIETTEGYTSLMISLSKGFKNIVRMLIDNNAEVDVQANKDGNTVLHYAVIHNQSDLIPYLLKRQPNFNITNKLGQTALDIALLNTKTEIYQILVEEFNIRVQQNIQNSLNAQSMNSNNLTDLQEEENNTNTSKIIRDSANSTKSNNREEEFSSHNNTTNTNNHITNNNSINLPNPNFNNYNNFNNNFANNNQRYGMHNSHQNNNFINNVMQTQIPTNPLHMASSYYNTNPSIVPSNNLRDSFNQNLTTNITPNQPSQHSSNSNLNTQNINININNLSNPSNINNLSNINLNSVYKSTKSAKLQKLSYLQEKRQSLDSQLGKTNMSIKDKMFKFPFGQQNNNNTNIEIPFSFQNQNHNSITQTINKNNKNQLHTFIKIQSTPVLHIDISDDCKQDQLVLTSQLEEVKSNNNNQQKRIYHLENEVNMYMEENNNLKMELNRIQEELKKKDNAIGNLNTDIIQKENDNSIKLMELQNKYEDKTISFQNLLEKFDKNEKELNELRKNCDKFPSKMIKEMDKKEFLDKKFSVLKYDEKYIIKCLQRDILDFQDYTKYTIKSVKATQEELIKLIQDAVSDVMPDYEVKLYGSHATNLCLQWSDLDVVLVNKRNYNASSYQSLQSLYVTLLDKTWKKSIKFIDSAIIPIIKMTSSEQYNNMHIDISLQDSKHYGLKCVELVKSFMKEYEALEPLIFALKNILKNANLNDPYTGGLSSYGLILMVVSFLQSQQETKKPIKIADGNLGRMFLEFLWYYGLIFDHTKYVIYAYPTNDSFNDKDSINFLYNMQPTHELIIVDPLSKSNNVAKSTYQFVNIKMAFMIGFVVSHEECECGCHFNKIGDDCNVYNSEHCILKRIFNSVKRFTNANTGGG